MGFFRASGCLSSLGFKEFRVEGCRAEGRGLGFRDWSL